MVYLGLPHSQIVDAVKEGKAEVGIVRTGVLETMQTQGKSRLEPAAHHQRPAQPRLSATVVNRSLSGVALDRAAPYTQRSGEGHHPGFAAGPCGFCGGAKWALPGFFDTGELHCHRKI
jgi:hypothetical protein